MSNDLHPIQLQGIRVLELSLHVTKPDRLNEDSFDGIDLPFEFLSGHSEFNQSTHTVTVGVIGVVGKTDEENPLPFYIKAHLLGQFVVDVARFPVDKVDDWANKNAPLILLPFLREHIYGLASRAGIREVVIPLFTVPTVKIISPGPQ